MCACRKTATVVYISIKYSLTYYGWRLPVAMQLYLKIAVTNQSKAQSVDVYLRFHAEQSWHVRQLQYTLFFSDWLQFIHLMWRRSFNWIDQQWGHGTFYYWYVKSTLFGIRSNFHLFDLLWICCTTGPLLKIRVVVPHGLFTTTPG